MCGIFGIVPSSSYSFRDLDFLAKHSQQRGKDSSGLFYYADKKYYIHRADYQITKLIREVRPDSSNFVMGHSRLITNGMGDNQPVLRDNICVIHNGIIVNDELIWDKIKKTRQLEIDTEVIVAIASAHIEEGRAIEDLPSRVFELCEGVVACALALPKLGKLCLFSNNGSLYIGTKDHSSLFASESYSLTQLGCENVRQIKDEAVLLDIPVSHDSISISENSARRISLIPALGQISSEEKMLEFKNHNLRRCQKCVLPETMPFISFDSEGVCNYCKNRSSIY